MSNDSRTTTSRVSRTERPWFLALGMAFALAACAPDAADNADTRFEGEEPMAETEAVSGADSEMTDAADAIDRSGETTRLATSESASIGEFIVGADDRPLYLFTADTRGEASACYDACAEAWPPVTDDVSTGSGVDASLLGTITRDDGSLQVTYSGWPLYEFARDEVGAEPQGQEIESFGGEWYLITPAGEKAHAGGDTEDASGMDSTEGDH